MYFLRTYRPGARIAVFAILLLCFCGFSTKTKSGFNPNLIILKYGGPLNDRDIPDIVFSTYSLEALKTQFESNYEYDKSLLCKVNESEFANIKREIEKSLFVKRDDSLIVSYYYIKIKVKNKESSFEVNATKIDSLFNSIIKPINRKSEKQKAKGLLNMILQDIEWKKKYNL